MAQCKDCIHNDICQLYKELGVKILCYPCDNYISANVVPRGEVERLRGELARANRILREIKLAYRWGNYKKVGRLIEWGDA